MSDIVYENKKIRVARFDDERGEGFIVETGKPLECIFLSSEEMLTLIRNSLTTMGCYQFSIYHNDKTSGKIVERVYEYGPEDEDSDFLEYNPWCKKV